MQSRNIASTYFAFGAVMSPIKRAVALFFILDFLWRGYSHLWMNQLLGNALTFTGYSPSFIFYKLSGWQQFVINNPNVALFFDLVMLLSWIMIVWKPLQKVWQCLAFFLFFMYSLAFPVHLAFPAHYLSAMMVIQFVFLFHREDRFSLVWQAMRYYVCFVYGSAFVWKILNGAMWDIEGGTQVIKNNVAQYLLLNPESTMAQFYYWSFTHPGIIAIATIATYVMEGLFLLGFFTRKWDYFLIVLIIVIHFGLYIVVDTLFVEWYIFILPLLPLHFWDRKGGMQFQ